MGAHAGGRAAFDHGAQYFAVRDPEFDRLIKDAAAADCVARWLPRWPGGEQEAQDLWVGVPEMPALLSWLAAGLDVEMGCRIESLSRAGQDWALHDTAGGRHEGFGFVVITAPAPQAAALAQPHTELARRIGEVRMSPCWTVLAAFGQPVPVPLDAHWGDDPVLPWFARNSSKPGRAARPDTWVLHAGGDWSQRRLDSSPGAVQEALLERFARKLGMTLPPIASVSAHLWRHSRVETPLGKPFAADFEAGIGFCGDWCLDARVEAAFLSGDALGQRLVEGGGP